MRDRGPDARERTGEVRDAGLGRDDTPGQAATAQLTGAGDWRERGTRSRLWGNRIGNEGAKAFAAALKDCPSLRTLEYVKHAAPAP